MKTYELYDFERTENYIGQDRYEYIDANTPTDAIKKYMSSAGISGKILRTITDTNTRFIVRNSRGSYLYQCVDQN